MATIEFEPCFSGKVGQDTYESYRLITESENISAIIDLAKKGYIKPNMRHYDNWQKEKVGTEEYYIGFYNIIKTVYGYLLTICMPYQPESIWLRKIY